jgi:hypothetical protein
MSTNPQIRILRLPQECFESVNTFRYSLPTECIPLPPVSPRIRGRLRRSSSSNTAHIADVFGVLKANLADMNGMMSGVTKQRGECG